MIFTLAMVPSYTDKLLVFYGALHIPRIKSWIGLILWISLEKSYFKNLMVIIKMLCDCLHA